MRRSLPVVFVRYLLAWSWSLGIASVACVLCLVAGPRRTWTWVRRLWARVTLKLVGVQLDVAHPERLAGPAIYIANHQSLIDVVFLPAIVPATTRFVAKRELLWVPFWGWAFAAGGALLIDRKNPRAALQSLRRGAKNLEPGWSIVVFPEGTRTKDGELGRFKRGAFVLASISKLPVVPIGFDGAREVVPAGSSLVRGGRVAVHVGEPLDTTDWSEATLRCHIAAGEAAVAACVAQARAQRVASRGAQLASSGAGVLHTRA